MDHINQRNDSENWSCRINVFWESNSMRRWNGLRVAHIYSWDVWSPSRMHARCGTPVSEQFADKRHRNQCSTFEQSLKVESSWMMLDDVAFNVRYSSTYTSPGKRLVASISAWVSSDYIFFSWPFCRSRSSRCLYVWDLTGSDWMDVLEEQRRLVKIWLCVP
jgi:hypothetical protein